MSRGEKVGTAATFLQMAPNYIIKNLRILILRSKLAKKVKEARNFM